MTLVSLRPTAILASANSTGAFGDLADDSDATYVTLTTSVGGTAYVKVSLTDLTLPASAVVKTILSRVRYAKFSGAYVVGYATVYPGVYPATTGAGVATSTAAPMFNALTPLTTSSSLQAGWTDTDCDNAWANLSFPGQATAAYRIYEYYFDVRYVLQPTLVVDLPTGTVTDTNTPTVSWTDTLDADGGAQTSYEVKIYSAAQYGAGGFDPATSTVTTGSGVVAGSDLSWVTNAILANATYRAYVRVAQTVNGTLTWSAWTFGGFVINVALPAVPTLTATADSTLGRIRLDLTAVTNPISNPSLETNTANWSATAASLTTGATLTQDATVFFSGTKSLKIVTTAAAASQGAGITLPDLEAGMPYTLSLYVKGNAGSEPLAMQVVTSAGGALTVSAGAATQTLAGVTTSLQRYTLAFTPTTATIAPVFAIRDTGAAVRTWFIDAVMLAPNTTVAPTYYDGATTDRMELQRSIDAGVTWAAVRTTNSDAGLIYSTTARTTYDYEAPNGTATQYRTRSLHSYTGVYAASAWSGTQSATWSATDWWLKHPNLPAVNLKLTTAMVSYADVGHTARQGVFQPLGAALPVVVSDTRGGATGTIILLLSTEALQDALDVLLDTSDTLLLQGPVAEGQPDRYVRIGDHSSARIVDKSWAKATKETLPWIEVALPPGVQS